MIKKYEITEEEFEVIINAIEEVLGYCGTWDDNYLIKFK